MAETQGTAVPVVLLGGRENQLSAARRFIHDGIPTVVINRDRSPAMRTRGAIAVGTGDRYDPAAAFRWLQNNASTYAGAVLIGFSDQAIQGLVRDLDQLQKYRPALFDPQLVTAMLSKRSTLELAAEAGVPAPRHWIVPRVEPGETPNLPDDLTLPVLIKPVHSFEARTKYLRAETQEDVWRHLADMSDLPSGVVLNEFIPGGDELLSSYYALRDPDGTVRLEFTKRVDRRNPPNKGGATFHELIDLPETAEAGRRFFDHIGLVGLGNVEFKLDTRTGELKIIECNYRLTAALPLMQDHGIDLAGAVYDQTLGRPVQPIDTTQISGLMWYPARDLISHRLSGDGIGPWLRRPWLRASLPYWRLSDPQPSLGHWIDHARSSFKKHSRKLRRLIPIGSRE